MFKHLSGIILSLALVSPAVAQDLQVITKQPQGQVTTLTQIVVGFDQDMRALGVMEQDPASSPLQISSLPDPLPSGNFRWLDTRTLAYLFDQPVSGPFEFTVTVPAKVEALNTSSLAQAVSWQVNTPALLLEANQSSTLTPHDAVLILESNYQLNPDSLREKTSIYAGNIRLNFELRASEATGLGRPSRFYYYFELQDELQPSSLVNLRLEPGLRPLVGQVSAEAYEFEFQTFERLTLEEWRTGLNWQGNQDNPEPEAPLRLSFNNPVKLQELLDHLSFEPAVELNPAFVADDQSAAWFSLPYLFMPQTRYQARIDDGLTDIWGTSLAEEQTFSFKTGDFAPLVWLEQGTLILERDYAGLPFLLRNVSPLQADLRYTPWSEASIVGYNQFWELDSPWNKLADFVQIRQKLDFSKAWNSSVLAGFDLPALFRDKGVSNLEGPIELNLAWQQRDSWSDSPMDHTAKALLQVTNLGLTWQSTRSSGLIWVTSLADGLPVADAELSLRDDKGQTIWSGSSNSLGLAVIPGHPSFENENYSLLARKGDDLSLINFRQFQLPKVYPDLVRNLGGPNSPQADSMWRIHSLTQAPLYQPGELVNFQLLIGHFSDQTRDKQLATPRWLPLANEFLEIVILDSRGQQVYEFSATSNELGSVDSSFPLPEQANLGAYSVEVTCQRLERQVSGLAWQVAAFRLPDFRVDLTVPPDQPLPLEQDLHLQIAAAYFSGAVLPGASVDLQIQQSEQNFIPPLLTGYRTGLHNDWWPWFSYGSPWPMPVEEPSFNLRGVLDADGQLDLTLPLFTATPGPAQQLSLEATVTDATGLTTQGSGSFMLHPSAWYLGMRGPRFVPAGREAMIDFKAATWDNQPLSQISFTLRAERLVQNDDEADEYELLWEQEYTLADQLGLSVPVSFEQGGQYFLTGSLIDEQGRINQTRISLNVIGARLDWLQRTPGSSLELYSDQDQYQIGDTALINFVNPFNEPAQALVTVEQGDLLEHQVVEIPADNASLAIELDERHAPYAFVSITLVKGRGAPPPNADSEPGSQDAGRPGVQYGVILLNVEEQVTKLSATVSTDQTDYRPGAEVLATVQVGPGRGQTAQVTLLAIDERVLRAAGEANPYNPTATFANQASHGVYAVDTRTRLANLNLPLFLQEAGAVPAMFSRAMDAVASAAPMPEMAMENAMGGADLLVREDFNPFVFWLANGVPDAQGNLEARFNLPDSLTSYRIVAVVMDDFYDFATAETRITASQPLQLLSALPRFVVQGDHLEARVLVQNNSELSGQVQVLAQADNLELALDELTLDLPAGQSVVAIFPAIAGEVGLARLQVTANMGEERDSAIFQVPVQEFVPLTTVAAAGLLQEGESRDFPVLAPSPLDQRSNLQLSLAASPAAGLSLTAGELLNYPWQCLEQRLTKAWVRAMRLEHGDLLGLEPVEDDWEMIREIMLNVPAFQQPDGGFALWQGLAWSDFYLTAYVLLVNSQVQSLDSVQNLGLPTAVVQRAQDYLDRMLGQAYQLEITERPSSLAASALSLYVLWQERPDLVRDHFLKVFEQAVQAAEQANYSNPLVWACLLDLTGKLSDKATGALDIDVQIAAQIAERIRQELEKTANITPTQLHFGTERDIWAWHSLGSNLRDNGLLLGVLAENLPDYPRLEALAWWLSQGLGERSTLSTQEGVFGLWGLLGYLRTLDSGQNTVVSATWQDGQHWQASFERLLDSPQSFRLNAEDLFAGQQSTLRLQAQSGSPYWTARLAYASPSLPLQPENAGFTLSRAWKTVGPWHLGQIVQVELTFTVPASRRHVLLFDPFPAGLEPVHATRADLAEADAGYPFQFADMRTDGLLLYAFGLSPGTYTYTYSLRAATPGQFWQRPSYIEEMYTPEVFGRTGPDQVEVLP